MPVYSEQWGWGYMDLERQPRADQSVWSGLCHHRSAAGPGRDRRRRRNGPHRGGERPALLASVAPSATLCAGNATNLSGVASGGTPPYVYSWSPTNFLDDPTVGTAVATPPSGTTNLYTLIEPTDAAGCTATNQLTVTVNPVLTLNVAASTNICAGNVVNLNGVASGGTSPYAYSWSPTNFLDDSFRWSGHGDAAAGHDESLHAYCDRCRWLPRDQPGDHNGELTDGPYNGLRPCLRDKSDEPQRVG